MNAGPGLVGTTRAGIVWAPRVERWKVRRLYESEAAGRLDEDLLEDVGISLFARCESILEATEAHRGHLDCPACQAPIEDPGRERFRRRPTAAVCAACGWSTTWLDILKTVQGKELVAGAAEPYFRQYLKDYARARDPGRKMLLIDNLLHEFHSSIRFGDVRPAAVNVLEGRVRNVMAFLDELAGFSATPAQESWRRRAPASVFGRHLGSRAKEGAG